jgi:hypothetical protein
MIKTFIINIYYNSLIDQQADVKAIKEEVIAIAGTNWRVVQTGRQLCTIAFATDKDPATFEQNFYHLGNEKVYILFLEIAQIHAGHVDKSVYQWFSDRLALGSSK